MIEVEFHHRRSPLLFGCGFFLVVVFPLAFTWLIPCHWLRLGRTEKGGVRADVYPAVFLVIPRGHRTLDLVEGVDARVIEGDWSTHRDSDGRTSRVKAEDEGSLALRSGRETLEIPVSPATLHTAKAKIDAFLADEEQAGVWVYTVANWKAGFFFALPFCLIGLAWVCGAGLALVRWVLRLAGLHAPRPSA